MIVESMKEAVDPSDLFVLYKQYSGGGGIWLMRELDSSEPDYKDILAISECMAAEGHEVKVLRAVHYKDPLYRKVYGNLIGTRYYRKCPDLIIDNNYVEYESYKTNHPKRAFHNMLHNGLAQSDSIIIRQCDLSDGYIYYQICGYIKKGIPVSNVWIYDGRKVRVIYNTVG